MGSIFTEASSCVSSFSPRSISFCMRYITFFRSSSRSRNSDRICSTCAGGQWHYGVSRAPHTVLSSPGLPSPAPVFPADTPNPCGPAARSTSPSRGGAPHPKTRSGEASHGGFLCPPRTTPLDRGRTGWYGEFLPSPLPGRAAGPLHGCAGARALFFPAPSTASITRVRNGAAAPALRWSRGAERFCSAGQVCSRH